MIYNPLAELNFSIVYLKINYISIIVTLLHPIKSLFD